jgi:hypothetical protein
LQSNPFEVHNLPRYQIIKTTVRKKQFVEFLNLNETYEKNPPMDSTQILIAGERDLPGQLALVAKHNCCG